MPTYFWRGLLRALWLTSALVAGGAIAQTRAAVLTFTGPQAAQARTQVVKAVCAKATCVPQATLSTARGPNWAAIRKEKVERVLIGRVTGPAARRVLTVEVFDDRKRRLLREKIPLNRKGVIPRRALDKLVAQVTGGGGRGTGQAAQAPEGLVEVPSLISPPVDEPPPGEEEEETTAEIPALTPLVQPSPAAAEPPGAHPLLVAEVGMSFVYRRLGYTNLAAPNLRAYETRPMLLAPRFRLELYPLTLATGGLAAGLGVELDYQVAVLLRSVDENDLAYPTRYSRFDAGLRMNFSPVEGHAVQVAPVLGFRGGGFRIGRSAEGGRLLGMPNIAYDGLRAGAVAEAELRPILMLVRLEYIHGLDLGELGSEAFFPQARARSVEAQLGLGFRITDQLDARLRLTYTRYGFSFSPAEDATYRASGAVDSQLGLGLTARYVH